MVSGIAKQLLSRRVPQIVGIYLGVSAGLVGFLDILVDRYPVSPYLVTFAILLLATMLPTVSLLAYYHGKPGHDKWTRTEQIGIPVNVVVAATILLLAFGGKSLGATTTTITVTDEAGVTSEREVLKNEFRKHVALFWFDNESGDSTLDWLQVVLPGGLLIDLSQDLFMQVRNPTTFSQTLTRAGFPSGLGLPLALKREITDKLHLSHFVSGTFTRANDEFSVNTAVYEVGRGKPLEVRTFTGADLFEIVDSMSVQLKRDLGVPAYRIEEVEDRPASEIMTNSLKALRLAGEGFSAMIRGDLAAAFGYLEQAVEEDPTFAFIQYQLAGAYNEANQPAKAAAALAAARRYDYKLPEWMRHHLNYLHQFYVRQDADAAFETVKLWVQLFPDDIEAHNLLALQYNRRRMWDEAIEENKRILELDPERYNYLRVVASYHRRKGEFPEALEYYQRYAEQFPDDYVSFTDVGSIHELMGEHEQARANYQKALVLEPDNVSVIRELGELETIVGNFEQALEQYKEALRSSRTSVDSAVTYWRFRDFYRTRGQLGRAIDYMHLAWAENEKFNDPVDRAVIQLQTLPLYAEAGRPELAFQVIDSIGGQLSSHPWDRYPPFARLLVYLELEDAENAQQALDEFEPFIEVSAFENYRDEVAYAKGRIHEMRGEYQQALESYQRWLELEPTSWSVHYYIARCYRQLENLRKARESVHEALKLRPFSPSVHFEMALIQADKGDHEDALEHLETALDIWKDADPEFKPAQRVREKLAELTAAS